MRAEWGIPLIPISKVDTGFPADPVECGLKEEMA
jgi:hypothetical protein